jgi:UDP-glucose 4-epimerase
MFGLDFVVFRPHNVFGPRQNIGDRYRNVVGIFMNQILQGRPMTIFGDGTQTRAFSYIDDVAPLVAEAMEVPAARNEVFNIGADHPCSLNDLASAVAAAMGVERQVLHLPPRHEVQHVHASHEKVRRVFGARAQTSLRDGLAETVRWVRAHGARTSAPFAGIEIERNLPDVWRDARSAGPSRPAAGR